METTLFFRRKISFLGIFCLLFQIIAPWSNLAFAIGTSFQKNLIQANVPAASETRASLELTVNTVPTDGETITIGTSTITFMDIPGVDDNQLNTINGTGYIDLTYEPGDIPRSTHEIAASLRSLTNVFDIGHGELSMSGSANTAVFTTAGAESSPTPISFTDGTTGDITISSSTTGALPVSPVAQIVDFRPILPDDHLLYRASINGSSSSYHTTSSTPIKEIVEAIQPSLNGFSDVTCTEDDTKITCTADTAGIGFTYDAEIIDKTSLYNALNAEFADGVTRTTYKLTSSNYTPASWNAYVQSITDGFTLETNGSATDTMITDAIALIETRRSELAIPFSNTYDITDNATADSSLDAISYSGKTYVTYGRDGNIYFKEGIGSEELVGVGTSPAIAVSSNGNIGILYTNGGLKYKKKSSGTWGAEVEVVGTIASYDIDMDSSGNAHVVYDDGGTGGRGHVVYVVENGVGTWSAPIIELTGWYDSGSGNYYHNPRIKIDTNGKYHIAYEQDNWGGQASWSDKGVVITSNAIGGSAGLGGISWNMGITWSQNSLTLDGNNIAHFLYSYGGTTYHGTVSGDAWGSVALGLGINNPFISADGSSIGLAYNNGSNQVIYQQDDGSGFIGSTLIESTASPPALAMSNGEAYVYYVKNDGTDDEVKLASTTSIYTVPGQIDNIANTFVSSNLGDINLSGLEIGAVYAVMSGSTQISFGSVLASSPTSSLSINPAYFTNYGKYTLTLSGSYNGIATSNIVSRDLYIGPFDYQDLYVNQIAPALLAGGIVTNLGNVTYANVQSFSGLYFEKTGMGKIFFSNTLDLTNSGTIAFLQNLPSKLNIADGNINFDPTNSDFASYGAGLSMYFDTGSTFVSGINDPNNFVVRSSTGLILNSSGILSNVHGACGVGEPYCTIFFDTAHFTSFDLKPFLTDVTIYSNNTHSIATAKNGDRIVLDITGSELLPNLSVVINGTGASSVENLGSNHYRATSVPVDGGTGIATFGISFMDANGNNGDYVSVTTDASSVTLDTTLPTITETTPVTSLTDDNTPDVVISASELSTPSFSGSCSASTTPSSIGGGINTITFYTLADGIHNDCYITLTDAAGNHSNPLHLTSFTIDTTAPVINYEQVKDVKDTNVNLDVSFSEPNMGGSPYGIVTYTDGGSSTGTSNFYFSGDLASTTLTGLNPNTAYTYTVTLRDSLGNTRNSIGHFSTALSIPGLEGDFTETGAIAFGLDGDLNEGDTYNLGGNLYLYSDPGDDSSLTGSLVFSGVNILASVGNWDGVLIPPTLVDSSSDEAATGSEIGSGATVVETVKAGSETAGLESVGGYFTISFAVPGYSSGTTFSIYRSEDGSSWILNTPDNTCTLDAGMMCTFRTDHLSFFAPVIDTTPDAFSFTPVTGAELSTSYTSNTITVSGIATGTTISIVGGSYQIGSGSFVSSAGVVQDGETVKVRATSSSSYSSTVNTVLTIGGVSATYSIATKAASSGGNGGGGGGGLSIDYCPNGDTSGSSYDNKCTPPNQGNNSGNTGGTGSTGTNPSFKDIANSFARVYIESLSASGIISGYPNGTFHPNVNITRADWIVWVMKAYKVPLNTSTGVVFKDIPKNLTWILPYINTAKEMGIISGQTINGKLLFRPNASITRAEALKILFLVAKENLISNKKLTFTDSDFATWMLPYIIRANELGIVSGQTINGKLLFRPNASITRAEATKILYNFLKLQR